MPFVAAKSTPVSSANRQPVEVRAHQCRRAVAVAEDRDDAVAADGVDNLAVESAQLLQDAARGSLLFVGELGMAVEVFVEFALPA